MGREIQTVLICGYGVMGQGVARTFAAAGFRTLIYSRRAASLADLPPGSMAVDRLPVAAPDLAIEFALEEVAVKQAVYRQLEAAYPNDAVIIATGTSGLDLVELARPLARPERFVGLHYFMPADTSPVVEVMAGPRASAALVDRVADAVARTGKDPVRLYNRLLAPRMCLNGLIQQKDISGLKVHAAAQRSIVPALFHNGVPSPLLQAMVARGETGLAAGKGFYDWSGREVEQERARSSRELAALLAFLEKLNRDTGAGTAPPARDSLAILKR